MNLRNCTQTVGSSPTLSARALLELFFPMPSLSTVSSVHATACHHSRHAVRMCPWPAVAQNTSWMQTRHRSGTDIQQGKAPAGGMQGVAAPFSSSSWAPASGPASLQRSSARLVITDADPVAASAVHDCCSSAGRQTTSVRANTHGGEGGDGA